MGRYLMFCGECYYPSGGASDFVRGFEAEEEALYCAALIIEFTGGMHHDMCNEWANILDTKSGNIIELS